MSLVDPQVIRSEQHAEIGNLVLLNVGIIIERWSRRAAQEQPGAQRVHQDVLQDHLSEFLQNIGRTLIECDARLTTQHIGPAVKHGEQRWEAGWSLPEVVRDYQILRLTLLEFLEETLDRSLRYREVLAIGLVLDESISASITAYIRDRDEYQAHIEAQRMDEMVAIQKQLRAKSEALEQADRRKNEFLAILAHELRNPLAPIRHALHILRLKGPSSPEMHSMREIIERQAQHMTRMIDDLFDISRIAHGKIKLDPKPIMMGSVIERAVEEVKPIVELRKHRLAVALPAESVWLNADAQRLTQVLVNLLINAAKYTNEGGDIHLTVEVHADDALLKVRDTGIGIPAELLPRIFEPFTQERQSEDRAHGGLGIGLALVRNLVHLHGGTVHASSAGRGHGSEFVIRLPILKEHAEPAPAPAPVATIVVPRRVLVVDDNRDAAHSLAILLRLSGHDVQTAHDGTAALELARTHRPEIILLDIGMPRMDGLEVARRIRQEPGLTEVLLVALTGYGNEKDRRRSKEAGFDVHLVKPVELDHLHTILQKPENA